MRAKFLITSAVLLFACLGLSGRVAGAVNKVDFDFGAKIGYMSPNESMIRQMYGDGMVFGADFIVWTPQGWGGGLTLERFSGSRKTFIMAGTNAGTEFSITVVPITLSGMYRFTPQSSVLEPYLGLGAGLYLVSERLKMLFLDLSRRSSDEAIGFHGLAGVKVKNVIVEMKYSSATIKSEAMSGESADIGGLSIYAGLRF